MPTECDWLKCLHLNGFLLLFADPKSRGIWLQNEIWLSGNERLLFLRYDQFCRQIKWIGRLPDPVAGHAPGEVPGRCFEPHCPAPGSPTPSRLGQDLALKSGGYLCRLPISGGMSQRGKLPASSRQRRQSHTFPRGGLVAAGRGIQSIPRGSAQGGEDSSLGATDRSS